MNKDQTLAGKLGRNWRRMGQRISLAVNLIAKVGLAKAWRLSRASRSQIGQDLFALSELGAPAKGFFVEFGATNGVDRSNSWMMEKRLGWQGILAEPARCWHRALATNRGCAIEHRCVWKSTGERLTFNEVDDPELSTIGSFRDHDFHGSARQSSRSYEVETISLADLLREHHAPPVMELLSIDTEGSEFEILEAFDFDRWRFRAIVCEHNYAPIREKIHALLTVKGYVRRYADLSRFDDWYVWQG
jgi:FkbM family methyltransferase